MSNPDLLDCLYKKVDRATYSHMIEISKKKPLALPERYYGAFCNRILLAFIDFHKLDPNLSIPNHQDSPHTALSKVFDIILHSLGDKNRERILKELDEYLMSING